MEIEQRISELEEIISGTIKSEGAYNSTNRKWEINYSSILTKLIQEAGRWCENYASDLFIHWYYSIENPLKNGLIKDEQITFAFHKDGVDHNEWYQNNKNDINYYRAVWFLDLKIMGDKMEMILHKEQWHIKVRLEYGKSMYGGWYAQNVYHNIFIHSNTLKEIKETIKSKFPWCVLGNRFDN